MIHERAHMIIIFFSQTEKKEKENKNMIIERMCANHVIIELVTDDDIESRYRIKGR